MKLNMNLITGKMNPDIIIYRNISCLYKFPLQYPVLYDNRNSFKETYLYIIDSIHAPVNPVFQGHCSFISIGMLPEIYIQSDCDIVCVSNTKQLAELFNDIQKIFCDYQLWEMCLHNAMHKEKNFEKIGNILYEQFQNPVELLNVGDRYLFRVYDHNRPENLEYYENFYDNSYPPMDELQVIYSLDIAMDMFTYHEPQLLSKGVYGNQYLYANLFVKDRFVGRIFVSDVYRPIQSMHFSLIQYLADELTELVDNTNTTVLVNSTRIEKIILDMIHQTKEYNDEIEQYMNHQNWKRYDSYQCVILQSHENIKHNRQLASHAVYLSNIITDFYPLVLEDCILAVFHKSSEYAYKQQMARLQIFVQVEQYSAGCSDIFTNFADLHIYYEQARETLNMMNDKHETMKFFNTCVMDYVYKLCLDHHPSSFYIIDKMKSLLNYDQQNQTEMYKTLCVYLQCGMNVSKALNILFIHRSTFNYRITKIEKILGMALNNYKNRQYLQFAIGLIEYEKQVHLLQ